MNKILKILIKIGLFGIIVPSLMADESEQTKIVEPRIGIVEAAPGLKIDLDKIKAISIKFKFDWRNVLACHVFGNCAVFVNDANGPNKYIDRDRKFVIGEFPGEKANKIPTVAHFEIVLREYSYSIQNLEKISEFQKLQTIGIAISRKNELSTPTNDR